MDNVARQVEPIRNQGMFFTPIAGDRKLPTCAIAAVAAGLLSDGGWTGFEEVPVLGPEDLSSMALEDRLRSLYDAFNAREVDEVLAALTPDVEWPNGWVTGHQQVRDYWQRQWAEIDGSVQPEEITEREDGSVEVVVHQVVKDLGGQQLLDTRVRHAYWFREDLVRRMEIEQG